MAGVKGRSGPPGNNNAGEAATFRALLHAEYHNGGRDRLRAGIRALAEKAEEGEQKALEFFRDSLDGKPAQAVQLSGDANNPVRIIASALSDDDLARIAAGSILPIQQEPDE